MQNDFIPKSDFLQVLLQRGFVHQCSDFSGLDEKALAGGLKAYIGFDCTAPSLHVGSLLPIMMLSWLQKTGGQPLPLMGGGTTRVGDPSGKDESRKLLTVEQINENKASIHKIFERFLTFGAGSADACMLDNADWLAGLNYIEFLRDVGRHFSVNRMLTMDSVKMRLQREHELSFIEFNYMCLQAYDFVEINRRYGAVLQMGGSDQWGNIVTGLDLGRRMGAPQLYALTSPLLTTSSGAKMGKTAAGAIWLNADMLSPYDYWQYWRNSEDADVSRFLKLFTFLPMDEISRLEKLHGSEINEAKKTLATEATALVHGRDAAEQSAHTARTTFEEGATALSLPKISISQAEFELGFGVLSAFVKAGLATSTGDARRQIKGGALRINDVVVTDERGVLSEDDFKNDGVVKLSAGKKKHILIERNSSIR
jgi:tyrosyl-tRNA synthetase